MIKIGWLGAHFAEMEAMLASWLTISKGSWLCPEGGDTSAQFEIKGEGNSVSGSRPAEL